MSDCNGCAWEVEGKLRDAETEIERLRGLIEGMECERISRSDADKILYDMATCQITREQALDRLGFKGD